MNSAALVRFTARINMVCVKKRHVGNYQEMEGQRDGSLFGTAWTLMLSESENGISLPQRKETALPFCPFVSGHVCCATPDAPTDSVVMASFLSGHLVSPINGKPFVQSFIQVLIYEGQWQPGMHSGKRLPG